MPKHLILTSLALIVAGSSAQTQAGYKVPKECVPVLRIPVESYVPYPALFSPPDGPRPYSVYYYNLYETFCHGKAEKDCIWTCAPVVTKTGAVIKAGF